VARGRGVCLPAGGFTNPWGRCFVFTSNPRALTRRSEERGRTGAASRSVERDKRFSAGFSESRLAVNSVRIVDSVANPLLPNAGLFGVNS
jgi:hypothetical protein